MSELLDAAEERWRMTVDNAPIGIALVSLSGRFIDANEALCAIYECTREQLLELHTWDLAHPDDVAQLEGLSRQLLAGVIPRFRVRKRHVRPDGRIIWAEVYVALALHPDGTPSHFLCYVEDVTEHVATAERLDRFNQDLTRQTARLARSNDDLESFATVASHDLQAPLSTIRGYLELLQSEYGDDLGSQGALWMTRASDAASRMSALLTSLLEFSRAAGAGTPKRTPLTVDALLHEVLADLDGDVASSGVQLRRVGTHAEVLADPPRIRQVLQNLLQNAVKYRHPERAPQVTVRVIDAPEAWQIEVEDNGVGVAATEREAIFGMFRQASRDGHGFGVGLAITRRIVERHGGSIWVEPVAEGGSRFCFTLPRAVLPLEGATIRPAMVIGHLAADHLSAGGPRAD